MSYLHTGNTLGLQVLEALGIEAKFVTEVQISLKAGEVATAQITVAIYDEQARAMVDHFSAYKVVEAEAKGEEDIK